MTANTRLSDTHARAATTRVRAVAALARMRACVRVWKITRIMDFPACKALVARRDGRQTTMRCLTTHTRNQPNTPIIRACVCVAHSVAVAAAAAVRNELHVT